MRNTIFLLYIYFNILYTLKLIGGPISGRGQFGKVGCGLIYIPYRPFRTPSAHPSRPLIDPLRLLIPFPSVSPTRSPSHPFHLSYIERTFQSKALFNDFSTFSKWRPSVPLKSPAILPPTALQIQSLLLLLLMPTNTILTR